MDGSDFQSSRRGVLVGLGALISGTPYFVNVGQTTETQCQNQQTATDKSSTTTSQTSVPPGTSPSEVVSLGEKATIVSENEEVQITCWIENIDVFESYTVSNERVTPEGVFVHVTVNARNNSDEQVTVNSDFFELVTPVGQAYEPHEDAMLSFEKTFYTEQLDPQITKTRDVFFDAPADSSPWWLKIGPSVFYEGEPVYFELPDAG